MIRLKVRHGKNTILNSRVSDIEFITLTYGENDGYIGLNKRCVIGSTEIHTPCIINQRITFYDSGRRMKEFVLPINSSVESLIAMYDQVMTFYKYVKTVESIDILE